MANFIEKITEQFTTLSQAQQKVAHYLLENTEEVIMYTAQKIAEAAQVSEATVHRLAQNIGYGSFAEMKQDIHIFNRNDYRAVNNLRTSTAIQQDSWLEKHFMLEADNIMQTSQNITSELIHQAAKSLLNANHIWVAGWRMGLTVTAYMQFVLKYMLGNCQLIPQGEAAEYTTYFKQGDTLFVSSYPRYCKKTLTIAEMARKKGMDIIAITDSQVAPICQYADIAFFAKRKSKSFLDSYTAAVSVCNAIVNEIAYIGKEQVMNNIQAMEGNFSAFLD